MRRYNVFRGQKILAALFITLSLSGFAIALRAEEAKSCEELVSSGAKMCQMAA
jgi:hypothetical protein